MGNEMGNYNTSEFREEDNRSPETEGKAQKPVHSNDLKEENHVVVPTPESKDYHEKETELAFDHPKAAPDTNGKDEEEDLVNTTSVAIALAHDPECEDSAEHEYTQVEVGQSEQENTNSPKQVEEISSLVDFSESNIDFSDKQKSPESDNNSEGSVDTRKSVDCLANGAGSQENTRLSDEQLLQVGNEDSEAKSETKNDGEMESNGTNSFESQPKVDMDDSLRSDVDVSMPVDKCIILTEETKLIAKESENGDSNHDATESDSEVEEATNSSTGTNCKNGENEDPTVAAHDASSNGKLQVEGMKVTEESSNQNKDSEELWRVSEAKLMMVHWHESLNESGDYEPVASEGRIELVPELVDLTPKLSITNGTYSKEESEDYKSEEEEPEKERSFEIEAKTEAPVLAEDQQQKTAMKCEDAQVRGESTPEVKLESSSELLGAVVSPFDATNTSMETLVLAVELPIEKHEEAEAEAEAEAVLLNASEIAEILTETNYSASENQSGEQLQEVVASASNGLVPESSTTIEKTVTEAKLSASGSAEQSNEQSEKVETSMSERVVNEEQESTGRFSIESIPDSFSARAEMRKSPSFGIDLRIEARNEESDHTPLLYQNMNTNEDDVILQTSLLPVEYNQQLLKDQPLPLEEKVITLERSDSDKSRPPLFEKQDSSEKDSTNPKKNSKVTLKSKDKHKRRRPSLFTNCMCCTTV